ncbi:hypothetical protein JKP88DRAFT_241657 [Tribonema minus]|uniref:Uncharacterized protein n=1 Tax=Tribonema minus TaxID=303371 RepID=A0A836CEZ5_9STRA|nr:hypothetical protein JKP88DRAFT_241657 [Tribonema minus]
MGRAAAQEYLANAMKDIHSSLDAAITNYNQTLRIQYASCLRPSKYQRVNDGYGTEATDSVSSGTSGGSSGGTSGGGISSWGADTYGGGAQAMPYGKDMLILQQRQTAAMEQLAAATAAAQATSVATQATLAAVLAHIQGKQDASSPPPTTAAPAPSVTAAPSSAASHSIPASPFTKAAAPMMPPQQYMHVPPPPQQFMYMPPSQQFTQVALTHQWLCPKLVRTSLQMPNQRAAHSACPRMCFHAVCEMALAVFYYFTGLVHMGNNTNGP